MSLPLKPKRLIQNGLVAHYAPIKQRNLLKWSEDFSNAVWAKSVNGTGSAPVVTSNYAVSPDGTNTASRIQLNKGIGNTTSDLSYVDQLLVNFTNPHSITNSVWLKSNDSNNYIVALREGTSTTLKLITITSTWQRFFLNVTHSSTTASLQIMLRGTYGTSNSADILVWGAQLELGTSATTYQKTTDLQTVWNQKQENMSVTNIVQNGNFASGTSGWSAAGVTATVTINNGTLNITGSGTSTTVVAEQVQINSITPLIGHKVYGKIRFRVTNSNCTNIGYQIDGSSGGTNNYFVNVTNPVQNNWYQSSGIATVGSDFTGNVRLVLLHIYADAATANGKVMEVQQVLVIDLTSLFGAGNEPTTQQCDEMFSWFDGSIRMNLNRYNGMLGSTSAVDNNDPYFDGQGLSFLTDDYVNIGNSSTFNVVNNDFTLFVVCKPTTTNLEAIIGKNTFVTHGWGIYQNAGKFNYLIRGMSAGKFVSANSTYSVNNNYLVVGRRMSNVINLFINRNKQTAEATIEETVDNSSLNFLIGKPANSDNYRFNGNVAFALMYNRALTDAEINQNYHVIKQECARLGVMLP